MRILLTGARTADGSRRSDAAPRRGNPSPRSGGVDASCGCAAASAISNSGLGHLGRRDFTRSRTKGGSHWVLPNNLSTYAIQGRGLGARHGGTTCSPDGLSGAQARAFAERLAGEWPNHATRAAASPKRPPANGIGLGPARWPQARRPGRSGRRRPRWWRRSRRTRSWVFGDEQTAPARSSTTAQALCGSRTVGGWAYLTAPAHGPPMRCGVAGRHRAARHDLRGPETPTEQARVIARPVARGGRSSWRHTARHENKPFRPDTARAAAAGATAGSRGATAEGLAALRWTSAARVRLDPVADGMGGGGATCRGPLLRTRSCTARPSARWTKSG